jgi:enoyl-CoA hydratase/carnithine racemase
MASFSKNISVAAKDSVNMAYNLPLDHGLEYEKRLFWGTFATNDQKEGMAAFSEKRTANFKHE